VKFFMHTDANREHPFDVKPLRKPGVFERMLGKSPEDNGLIELLNALGESANVHEVPETLISRLNEKYRCDIQVEFASDLQERYRGFLAWCLKDRKIDGSEADDLAHLRVLFGISDRLHQRIYQETAEAVYDRAISEILADDCVTEDEKSFLKTLAADMRLPVDIEHRLYQSRMESFLTSRVQEAVEDRILSPDEEEELHILADKLGIPFPEKACDADTLSRCRLLWRIAFGDPPSVLVSIRLQRKERCYFSGPVDWY